MLSACFPQMTPAQIVKLILFFYFSYKNSDKRGPVGCIRDSLISFRFFPIEWHRQSTAADSTISWRTAARRPCGPAIVGRVTRGNFCSGEQYVALTYCARATSTSSDAVMRHAGIAISMPRRGDLHSLWKGELRPRVPQPRNSEQSFFFFFFRFRRFVQKKIDSSSAIEKPNHAKHSRIVVPHDVAVFDVTFSKL